jgi:hypothetical protein
VSRHGVRVERPCLRCGDLMTIRLADKRRFCSVSCCNRFHHGGRPNVLRRKELHCEGCNQWFPCSGTAGPRGRRFCSRECSITHRFLVGKHCRIYTKACVTCGQPFLMGQPGRGCKQYCSVGCRPVFVVAERSKQVNRAFAWLRLKGISRREVDDGLLTEIIHWQSDKELVRTLKKRLERTNDGHSRIAD